jgi:GNAT superfamily N-acetyltransferase
MISTRKNIVDLPSIKKMKLSHLDSLMKIKNAESWNQTEQDWIFLINHKNSVNLVAIIDDKVIGTVTAINYENTVSWIGMVLVDRDYRGRGISSLLLREVFTKLKKCKSIKLDATPAGKPGYLKLGFIYEYTLSRMTNPSVTKIFSQEFSPVAYRIRPDEIDEIVNLDEKIFGANRSYLINYLYENYPELAWLVKENNKIIGFCFGRKGQNFTQIGPVSAPGAEHAKILIQSAINQITGVAVVVDILENKPELQHWLNENGFTSQRPFDRMYLLKNPYPGIINSQYLISGPEFG